MASSATRRATAVGSAGGAYPSSTTVVMHKNGTTTAFTASADTDAARGVALLAAVADSTTLTGDLVIVGRGTHDVASVIDLSVGNTKVLNLWGYGRGVSNITGSFSSTPLVVPVTGCIVRGLTIQTTSISNSPFGLVSPYLACTNVLLEDCELIGSADGVFVSRTTACTGIIRRCLVTTKFDTLFFGSTGAHAWSIYDSTITVTGPNEQDANTSRGLTIGNNTTIKMYSTNVSVVNGGNTTNTAIVAGGGAVELYDCVLFTSNTGSATPLDISVGAGSCKVNAGTAYDQTKTSGTVTVLNTRGTATAASGAATLNTRDGVITSEALTTAASSDYTLTLTNSYITAASVIQVSVGNGTNTTLPCSPHSIAPGAGSCTIKIRNENLVSALNGTITINYSIR